MRREGGGDCEYPLFVAIPNRLLKYKPNWKISFNAWRNVAMMIDY